MKPEGIQRPKILIIGNKPFVNLPLDSVVDHFEENCRCNISVPFKNNGTKFHFLYLCCHLYERLVQKSYSKDSFLNDSAYLPHYKQDYMASFYDAWTQYAPANIKHGNNRGIRFNAILQELGCPFTFSKLPRTGYVAIFDFLSKGYEVFVSHFSIMQEDRVSYYVKEGKYESDCHSKREELLILEWLHKNNHIDASLCLLEDKAHPVPVKSDLRISSYINKLLTTHFNSVIMT